MPERSRFPLAEALGLSVLAGVLGTFTRGYRFGLGDQVANLPFVLRALDPGFLAGDFFVDSTELFSPRSYYAGVMALAARAVPLPQLYLHLTWIAHVAVALVSYTAAWSLSKGSRLAGALAVVLVAAVDSVQLGSGTWLFRPDFVPSHAALPFALGSLWLGLAGRPFPCAVLALPAMILHPALGLELGALGLLACAPLRGKRIPWALAVVGLAAAAATLWWWPARDLAGSQRLLEVETFFRHPHHSVPSFFPRIDWARMLALLSAVGMAGAWLSRSGAGDRGKLGKGALVLAAVLASWVGGFVFVELSPSPLWAAARPFRLALVVKWLGLVAIACLAGAWLERATSWRDRIAPSLLVLACGPGQPELAAVVVVVGVAERIRPAWLRGPMRDVVWVALGAATAWTLLFAAPAQEALLLLWLLGLVAWLLRVEGPALRWGAPAVVSALFLAAIFAGRAGPIAEPVVTLDDHRHEAVGVARFALRETPPDALIVTPPDFGHFRLLAERATVVDFRCFPFASEAMEEWRERLAQTYGPTRRRGYAAAGELDRRYRRVSDARLIEVARRYGADFAVLYRETPTSLPVLYEDAAFKLVPLGVP